MKKLIIIPDKSFFKILYKININIKILDEIEENLGKIILTDKNYKDLSNIISKDLSVINYIVWKRTLDRYYQNYYNIIYETIDSTYISISFIKKEIDYTTKIIYKIISNLIMEFQNTMRNCTVYHII